MTVVVMPAPIAGYYAMMRVWRLPVVYILA